MNVEGETNTLSNSPRKTKSVRFAEKEEVHETIRRRSQISRQSMKGIWCDEEDFDAFMDDALKCVRKIERGDRLKDKKYSSLGLEHQTDEGHALKQAHKEYAWDMVLWEQKEQQKEGRRCSSQIREAYREASRDAEVRAVELARQVSNEVQKYYSKSGLDPKIESADLPMGSSRTKAVKVRFVDEPVVHDVLRRRSQISRPSKIDMWFDRNEFDVFEDDLNACIKKMDQGELLEDDKDSSLGLETREGRSLRHETQIDAWDTVLIAQEKQREQGITSPFQISRAYKNISKDSAEYAAALARQVSREVEADNLEPLKFCPSNACA